MTLRTRAASRRTDGGEGPAHPQAPLPARPGVRMARHLCTICKVDRRKTDGRDGHKMSCPVSKYGVTPMWRLVIVKDNR